MACAGWRGSPFVLPYLPLLLLFGILPMVYALDLAFTNDSGRLRRPPATSSRPFHDYRFMPAFEHILVYTSRLARRC